MEIKKTIRKIHLWLGLITGPVVFIVALTGAIYSFQEEIQNFTQDYRFTKVEKKQFLEPTELIEAANNANPGRHVHAVMYHKAGKSAKVIYYSFEDGYYDFVYVNPYSGKVQKVHDVKGSFFGFILAGHFNLWLPLEIGSVVVASSTLIFALILLSGLFLWWPKKNKKLKQKFTIKWNARWRRKNYDLHSVLGFYAVLFGLLFAFTGLIWGFTFFKKGVYSLFSGGKSYVEYYEPSSTVLTDLDEQPLNKVWSRMKSEYPTAEWIEIHIPHDEKHVIAANANPDETTYWKTDYRYFDQKTMDEKFVTHQYGRRHQASLADRVMRLNYDIHVGSVFGIPGKIVMCLLSLIIASLPVTGFLMWYGRRNKR